MPCFPTSEINLLDETVSNNFFRYSKNMSILTPFSLLNSGKNTPQPLVLDLSHEHSPIGVKIFPSGSGISGYHPVQPPSSKQSQVKQVAQGFVSLCLSISMDGDSTTSLGNLFQCSTSLTAKKLFICLNRIYCVFIHACCILSCHWALVPTSEFSATPVRYLYQILEQSWSCH